MGSDVVCVCGCEPTEHWQTGNQLRGMSVVWQCIKHGDHVPKAREREDASG